MERALVSVDDSDRHRELLREAGELAEGVGAELVLLATMTEEEYERDLETIERVADVEDMGYSQSTIIEVAANFADNIASEELEGLDVDHETVGAVVGDDTHADEIIRVAESRGCDHIFIAGRRRSPAGKAIFGDVAQSVILNYDGMVTVLTG